MLNQKLQLILRYVCRNFDLHKSVTLTISARCQSTQTTTRQSKPSYLHNIGHTPLVHRTIGEELQRAVSDFGSSEAIVSCHEGQRKKFSELLDIVDRVAAGLLKLGLQRGDHVGIWGPNNLHWYLTMLGVARAGLISVGINPAYQGPEVEYCLKRVNVKAIVTPESYKTQNFYEILQSICPELANSEAGNIKSTRLPHLRSVIIDTQSPLQGAMSFEQLLDYANIEEVRQVGLCQNFISPDRPCNVQFTSGTTGQPKAAVLSHHNFVNNGMQIGIRSQLAGERICVQVPLFHAYGSVVSIMAGLSLGATLVLPSPGFNAEASLRAIDNEKCSVINGTPTMYVDLIRKQKQLNLPLKTAKKAITGGAACSPALFMDIRNILGFDEVRTVMGLTELTAVVFQSRPDDTQEQILNTVGHLQDHIEVKIIDELGNTVQFGQPGELCVRGYVTMLGYHGDEQKTKETISAGNWLRTGDQFVLQEDGYGRVVGRLKDMIIRGGENIFPKEVEDFLNSHPHITEAHVVGVPDERMGEELCAFVRFNDESTTLSRDELKTYCKGKLAHFKVPRYVVAVNEFPKTTSGKIQKFKLKELFDEIQQNNNLKVDVL